MVFNIQRLALYIIYYKIIILKINKYKKFIFVD